MVSEPPSDTPVDPRFATGFATRILNDERPSPGPLPRRWRAPSTVSRERRRNGWKRGAERGPIGRPAIAGGYDARRAGRRAGRLRRAPCLRGRMQELLSIRVRPPRGANAWLETQPVPEGVNRVARRFLVLTL